MWIGIDPGGTWTGIVLRDGGELVGWDVIRRDGDETTLGPGPRYVDQVVASVGELVRGRDGVRVAMEDVTPPTGFAGGRRAPIDPAHVMGLAYVAGGVASRLAPLVVPAGKNGGRPLSMYPAELVTHAERIRKHPQGLHRAAGRGCADGRHHARSAWDVAGAAVLVARVEAARDRARVP